MDEPGDPPTRRSCLNSPVPIKTNDGRFAAVECEDWFLSIHRPNLSNGKKKKSVAAVDGHRSSEPHLDGSVVGAAGQSAIFRVPK